MVKSYIQAVIIHMDAYLNQTINCTFFIYKQPVAHDGGGVVEAVRHFTMVRPSAAPPYRQQQYGLFWRLVDHIEEASSVV